MTEEQSDERQRPPLTRSRRHRVVAGVCGGLGRYLDIDPVVFRVVITVLCLSGGLGLFVYGLAWLIVPWEEDGQGAGQTELQRVLTGRVDGQSIGAVLMTAIGMTAFFSSMDSSGQFFPLLLLGGLAFLAVRYDPQRRRAREQEEQTTPQSAPQPGAAGATDWGQQFRSDFRAEWEVRKAEMHEHFRQAREQAARARVADAPPAGASGYLWDPRQPECNPYGPRDAAPAWWQRTDLPKDDPLRKPGDPEAPVYPPGPAPAPWPTRRRRRSFLGGLGLLLAASAGTLAWGVAELRGTEARISTVLAAALLGLGVALLLGAKFGRARGLTVPALALTFALAGTLGVHGTVPTEFGDRRWVATSASQLKPEYDLGAGNARLDLSALDPAGSTLSTAVRLGAGDVTVTVPSDLAIRLTLRQTVGDVELPDGERLTGTGHNGEYDVLPKDGRPTKGTLDLTIRLGVGNIRVVQA